MSDQPKPTSDTEEIHEEVRGKVDQPKPTGEWTLVPRALHFNMMCDDAVIYEGITSEMQGKHLADSHNAALAAEREKVQTYEGALIKIANDPNCDRCQVAVNALAKVVK